MIPEVNTYAVFQYVEGSHQCPKCGSNKLRRVYLAEMVDEWMPNIKTWVQIFTTTQKPEQTILLCSNPGCHWSSSLTTATCQEGINEKQARIPTVGNHET